MDVGVLSDEEEEDLKPVGVEVHGPGEAVLEPGEAGPGTLNQG